MAARNFKLFLGSLGNGVTVCNSAVMENGDFKMVAHISNEGKITWYVSEDYPPADAREHPGLRRAGAGKVRDMAQQPVSGRAPGVSARAAAAPRVTRGAPQGERRKGWGAMTRDIHDYDSLKEAYDDLLMFERFPGPVRSERVENFVTQLKRDIREYVNRVSDCHIVRDELDSFVELVKLPEKLSPLSKESVLEWFYMHRAYRDDLYDGAGCSGQFFTTRVRLFRRRGCWYAYHFVSVDM